jgi:serine/threonine protein kinase
MDFIDGEDLASILQKDKLATKTRGRQGRRMSLRSKLEILYQISRALEHAHRRGIVHRDLKPANVIVTCEGRAVVTDFGLAKDVKEASRSGLTLSGQVMGTPAYMSPEQARGERRLIGPRSDVYALGGDTLRDASRAGAVFRG